MKQIGKTYFETLDKKLKEYFNILSEEVPEFLYEYIGTPEMQKQGRISVTCGSCYTKLIDIDQWYSSLDHSVAVALIVWHFTKDKKQTLAGLLHDIATPAFKHCIDFMNGDSEKQESIEERTTDIIKNSKEIMSLLSKDNICLEEVSDYKLYPIADNDTPRLSADRFEYTFSSGLTFYRVWELDLIKEVYSNIIVSKNEEGKDELTFKDKIVCEKYIKTVSKLWPKWVNDEDRTVMQFLADMCKSLNKINKLDVEDLYSLSEEEVINRFKNCQDKYLENAWENFSNCDKVFQSKTPVANKYCINVTSKTRYVNPLVEIDNTTKRIYDISNESKKYIDEYLKFPKGGYYTYFDFDFKPYE